MLRSTVAGPLVLVVALALARCAPAPAPVVAPTTTNPGPAAKPVASAATPPATPTASVAPHAAAPPSDDGQLQVTVVSPGSGPEAKAGDVLEVNYVGTFPDGTEFDSSTRPGRRPFRFTLGQGLVIKGWEQGLAGMKAGGSRRLVIPPSLAYGARARAGVPANSTLVFEIELLAINPP
jgi:FKBP-type peptidyl-prolyl cis-trans isomerase